MKLKHVLMAAALTAGLAGCSHSSSPSQDEAFDRAKWLADSGYAYDDHSARYREVGDVMKRVLRVGQSKHEVSRLLGAPEPTWKEQGNHWAVDGKDAASTWAYSICLVGDDKDGNSAAPDYLVIGFDKSGKVSWADRTCCR